MGTNDLRIAPQGNSNPVISESLVDPNNEIGTAIRALATSKDAEIGLEAEQPGLSSRQDPVQTTVNTIELVDDQRFSSALKLLAIIQRTIIYNKINVPSDQIHLGSLHTLCLSSTYKHHFNKAKCRPPTSREWHQVENKIITLTRHLDHDQIKKVQIKYICGTILEKVAILLLIGSIFALIAALLSGDLLTGEEHRIAFLACFTGWLATTGALGSAAFIYVNALSIQVDPTVDVTSRNLIIMRLILGALFAVILALPFGYQSFQKFSHTLFTPGETMAIADSALLLLPFILGFSTPLVLGILGRFILSAHTFFNLPDSNSAQGAVSKQSRSDPATTSQEMAAYSSHS